jgi:hypothetical protein
VSLGQLISLTHIMSFKVIAFNTSKDSSFNCDAIFSVKPPLTNKS